VVVMEADREFEAVWGVRFEAGAFATFQQQTEWGHFFYVGTV